MAKSDPSEYSIADLERDQTTDWTGVKNPQAQIAIRSMQDGDCVICYHSQGESAIVGWGYVSGNVYPDPAEPKLSVFRYRFGGRLSQPVTLADVKASGLFEDFALVRQSRLSTMPVPPEFVKWLKQQARDFRP